MGEYDGNADVYVMPAEAASPSFDLASGLRQTRWMDSGRQEKFFSRLRAAYAGL